MLISFSWQCSAKSIIYFHFKYNQKRLASTVCENKDKPKSCCEAKCYLEKEIKKEEKRESELPAGIKDKSEKTELNSGLISFLFGHYNLIQIIRFTYTSSQTAECIHAVFHPPSFA